MFLLFLLFPCMMIDVTVQYNGGLLPDIIRLYLHVSSSYHTVRDEWWSAAAAGQVRPPLAARSR